MTISIRNTDGRSALYGYSDIQRVFGLRRRTLENAVREGKLRKPTYIGKNAYWHLSDLDAFYAVARGDLIVTAVTSPQDVPVDQIPTALDSLGKRLFESVEGVAPSEVYLGRKGTQPEAAEFLANTIEKLLAACASLDRDQALAVAHGLFPALAPVTGEASMESNQAQVLAAGVIMDAMRRMRQ